MADSIAPENDAICDWLNGIELRRDFSHVENRNISKVQEMLADRGFEAVENDYSHIYLRINEWAARTKVSAEETEALHRDFLEAPAATCEAFQVAAVHNDIAFSWPCWVFHAVKGNAYTPHPPGRRPCPRIGTPGGRWLCRLGPWRPTRPCRLRRRCGRPCFVCDVPKR